MADSRRGEEKDNDKAVCDSDDLETKPKRQRKDKDGEVGDPLVVAGPDILEKILNFLDACSVARCLVVSRRWHDVATRISSGLLDYQNYGKGRHTFLGVHMLGGFHG